MASLCEGGNESPGCLKAVRNGDEPLDHDATARDPDIILNIKSRRLRWAGHVARMEKSINAYRLRLRYVGRYPRVAAMKGCITDDHRLFRLAFAEKNVKFDSDKDNHRVHTCVEVMTWFSERPCIRLIEWPPYSPDLNVLESVWSEVKKTVNAMIHTMPRRPTTKDGLWNIIKNAWDRVSSRQQYLRRLIAYIPRRMQAVIDVEGLHTRY
ncbi:hypothetical protein ANN_02692 [Periplaneta americana]|uniref:Tc1-like transposase DDE domain-containing protein n=1 Tax=Periplaneta americana TaxID=6978 RepID=A0ABQ8TZG8_PERAM|nr:hypothetical protein ANN_02692 [Periplaneta americana]